jgi:hypothetical protein
MRPDDRTLGELLGMARVVAGFLLRGALSDEERARIVPFVLQQAVAASEQEARLAPGDPQNWLYLEHRLQRKEQVGREHAEELASLAGQRTRLHEEVLAYDAHFKRAKEAAASHPR